MARRGCAGQLSLFDLRAPSMCAHERMRIVDGRKPKSLCDLFGCWTNCVDWGECTYDIWRGEREREEEVGAVWDGDGVLDMP